MTHLVIDSESIMMGSLFQTDAGMLNLSDSFFIALDIAHYT